MSRWTLLMLLAAAPVASGGEHRDYAREWPLTLSRDDGGAYRVVLTEEIYRAAQDANLADIEVFNANGEALPVTLQGPESAGAQEWPREMRGLPWFPLAADAGSPASPDLHLKAQLDGDGRIVGLDASVRGGQNAGGVAAHGALRGSSGVAVEARPAQTYLIDLSQHKTPFSSLQLQWNADTRPFQSQVHVSGSDDLQNWNPLAAAALADLSNGPNSLRRDRIEIARQHTFRYLRLSASGGDPLPAISAINAEAPPPPPEPEWRWLSVDGEPQQEKDRIWYRYALPARIPARQLDVRPEAGNTAVTWTVSSREGEPRPWTGRAGPWTGYRVASGDSVESSTPQFLTAPVREREWRVDAAQGLNAPPTLLLGYRPEVLVFLAQGPGPYTVAAGSAKARRVDAPLSTLLDALRRRYGADWKPYPAKPGTAAIVSGEAALQPPPVPPRPMEWKSWLLWGLLIAGTVVVSAMAMSLLQQRKDDEQADEKTKENP